MNENEMIKSILEREDMKLFLELIQMITDIPEENLNDVYVEVIKGAINGAFTETVKKDAIQNVIKSFRDSDFTYKEAEEQVNNLKNVLTLMTEEMAKNDFKKDLLNNFFNNFITIHEAALENYLKFDIVLPIKVENPNYVPTYAHETDAAADIYALEDTTVPAHSISNLIKTGLRIALPKNWFAVVVPRSSMGMKTGLRLSNSQGVIDSDYRGEIGVIYDNISDSDYTIKEGDRIAQMYIMPKYRFKPQIVDELEETERGTGAYGSTGK